MKIKFIKHLLIVCMLNVFTTAVSAQQSHTETTSNKPNPDKKIIVVETACGQCLFGLPGKGCNLAVRIDSIAYFVDGTDIDSHGDAHAKDGFCEAIRTAEIQGELVDNRFKVSYFRLLKNSGKNEK